MVCSYEMWKFALPIGFSVAAFIVVFAGIAYLAYYTKDANGKVGRDRKGRFKSLK